LTREFTLLFNRISGYFETLRPCFLVNDPKLVKKLAVKDFEYFLDHRRFLDENVDKLFGKSLFNMSGNRWRGK
jgi:cytochrome P450 family 9